MPRLDHFKLGESMVRQLGLDSYLPGFILNAMARELDKDWWINLHVPEQPQPCAQAEHATTPLIPSGSPTEDQPELDGQENGSAPSGLHHGAEEHPTTSEGVCVKLGAISQPATIKTETHIQVRVGNFEMALDLLWEISFQVLDPIWRTLRCGEHGCVAEEYVGVLRCTHKLSGGINLELEIPSADLGTLPSSYLAIWNGIKGVGTWDLTLRIETERVRDEDLTFLVNRYQIRPLPLNSVLVGGGGGGAASLGPSTAVPGNATWIANSADCNVDFSLLADATSDAHRGGRVDVDWEAVAVGPDGQVRQRRIRTIKLPQGNREYRLPQLVVPKACEPGFSYQNKFKLKLFDATGKQVGETDWIVDEGRPPCGSDEAIPLSMWLEGNTRVDMMFLIESECA